MAEGCFASDLLEATFYTWKYHSERRRVLSDLLRKYVQAANEYRLKACFLGLAVYAQERHRKAVIFHRFRYAWNVQKARGIVKAWRKHSQNKRKRTQILHLVLTRRARKLSSRILLAWHSVFHLSYSTWLESLTPRQLQHIKTLSHLWSLHLFKSFLTACHFSRREKSNRMRCSEYRRERLCLKVLISFRLWLGLEAQRRLDKQKSQVSAYEHYTKTLQSKAFSALADVAYRRYLLKLILSAWKSATEHRTLLRKYLQQCGLEVLEPKTRCSKTTNCSFSSDAGHELTIECCGLLSRNMLKIEAVGELFRGQSETQVRFRIKLPNVTRENPRKAPEKEPAMECVEVQTHIKSERQVFRLRKSSVPSLRGTLWEKRESGPPAFPLFQAHYAKRSSPPRKGLTHTENRRSTHSSATRVLSHSPAPRISRFTQKNTQIKIAKNLSFIADRKGEGKETWGLKGNRLNCAETVIGKSKSPTHCQTENRLKRYGSLLVRKGYYSSSYGLM